MEYGSVKLLDSARQYIHLFTASKLNMHNLQSTYKISPPPFPSI